jgi:preprotein translocase subunit YajC
MFLNTILFVLAQVTTQPTDTVPPPWWANPQYMLYAVLGIGIIFVISSSGQASRQEQKKHAKMLANLKRGDRVQTIGGIIGSVVEARETEIVLKVDESTNTKIRVTREAIKKVSAEDSDSQPK